MADEVSRRLSLLVPGELGAIRVDERLPVDVQPVGDPSDIDRSNIMPSLYPVRRAQWPIALMSNGQYEEWQDENISRKNSLIVLRQAVQIAQECHRKIGDLGLAMTNIG